MNTLGDFRSRPALRNGLLIFLAFVMLGLTLVEGIRIGADKVLPGPMQRHRDAIAIALTYVQYGKWLGYASYKKINQTLNDNGLNIQDDEVKPLGYKNYFDVMRHPEALDRAITAAASLKDVDSDGLYYLDANEKGMAIYYIISFLIFGEHVAGFFYLYVLLLAISVGIYALTFRRSTVPLLFLVAALTTHFVVVLLCQGLEGDVSVIHGSRFVSSLSILGMFQLMFLSQCRERPGLMVVLGTSLQVLILVLLLNARTTAVWEAITVIVYVGGWATLGLVRRWRAEKRPALWPAATLIAGLLLLQFHHMTGLDPHYLSKDGTSGHVLWHSVATALHDNPRRTERFGIPADIPVWDDRVSYDLFEKEIAARGLPLSAFLLGAGEWKLHASAPEWDYNWARYDLVMRDIVLRQIAADPLYAIESFFFYQPLSALSAILGLLSDAARMVAIIPALLLLAVAIVVAGKGSLASSLKFWSPLATAVFISMLPAMLSAVHPIRVIDLAMMALLALLWAICRAALRRLVPAPVPQDRGSRRSGITAPPA